MTTVETIERAIEQLSPDELAKLRRWFLEFDAAAWDAQIEADALPTDIQDLAQQANVLFGLGLRAKDALHISCAIAGGCTYFVTTDDEILKRGKDVQGITVVDPAAFVREMNL
jgi:predicted nucleic acid-binding protein